MKFYKHKYFEWFIFIIFQYFDLQIVTQKSERSLKIEKITHW